MACAGSSPRVRGTPLNPVCYRTWLRFIPACAGNTTGVPTLGHSSAVHPRVCGEHRRYNLKDSHMNGSSPRVRGTLCLSVQGCIRGRFIPACAGNTTANARSVVPTTVHPRVCGEHSSCKPLSSNHNSIVKEPTDWNACSPTVYRPRRRIGSVGVNPLGSAASGPNDTSRSPSRSTGTRRFLPQVSN